MKRKIELFTAGCPVCEPIVEMVRSMVCESCDLVIYNLVEHCDSKVCVDKLKKYKITSLPAVVVDGKAMSTSEDGITREKLISEGIGQAK